jgi:hypothetical protein
VINFDLVAIDRIDDVRISARGGIAGQLAAPRKAINHLESVGIEARRLAGNRQTLTAGLVGQRSQVRILSGAPYLSIETIY